MPTAPRPRRRPAARSRSPTTARVELADRPRREATPLAEDPHAHVVCRVCGRIQGLELTELDRHLLTELAELTPDGWSVERIAYSVAGACRRCREGPSVL